MPIPSESHPSPSPTEADPPLTLTPSGGARQSRPGCRRSPPRASCGVRARSLAVLAVLARLAVLAVLVGAATGAVPVVAGGPCYRHPVPAPVRRGFEAPACTWCAGHRGLEYATRPGDRVDAAAAGRIAFAGLVAGARWVTVEHPDGLRTSYGPLASVAVHRGQAVDGGVPVGTAAGFLHVGVRRGDTYLDPARLFARAVRLVPRLVPLSGPVPARPGPAPGCVR